MCAPTNFESKVDFDAPTARYRVEKYENAWETNLPAYLVADLRDTGHTVTPL